VLRDWILCSAWKKVDHKPYNSSNKPMETMQWDKMRFSSGGSASDTEKRMQNDKTACSTILLKLAASGLQHVLEKWVERCKKCIACQGRYFEKETVTAPPQFRLGVIRRVHELLKRPSYFRHAMLIFIEVASNQEVCTLSQSTRWGNTTKLSFFSRYSGYY
jgi:hypothetical protein